MSDLRSELLKIREARGVLTPRVLVEEAADPEHPLHHRFTWDDHEAADRWRLVEARQLLRVTFRAELGGRPADLRAFWVKKGTADSPESDYVPLEEIAMNPVAEKIMLQQMRRDFQRFRARYEVYSEFLPMLREILLEEEEGNGTEG